MTEYRLHDPKKGIIGPISLETVHDLINAGVVHDQMWVARDDGPFLPIGAFAEISPQPAQESSEPPQPTYSGDLGKNTFFKVFYRFHVTRSTGLLVVQKGEVRKEIFMLQGQPSYVTSNLEAERFGEFLVDKQRIDRQELKVALGSMHTDDNRLGYTLVRLGLLEPTELYDCLREQQTKRLVELCTWESGRYLYYDGLRYEGSDLVDLQLEVPELIIDAARGLSLESLVSRLRPHLQSKAAPTASQLIPIDSLRLTAFERRVAVSIDGSRTVAELSGSLTGDKKRAALMVVYLLWEIDAVALV
jgi:hypothetical protein